MKKFFVIAVAAVAAMASCSKTDLIETANDQNAINFNAFFHKATKANLTTGDNIAAFEVTAMLNDATYFSAISVSKSGTPAAWTYSPVQYWPASGTLDFFAWAPTASGTGISKNAYNVFTVAPAAAASSQYDFVVARTQGSKDATTGNSATSGVTINFRHAMSQIAVKVFNGNKNLQYDIYGWKVAGVDVDGTFTLKDTNTDTKDAAKLAYSDWSDNTGNFTGVFFDDSFSPFNKINTSDNEDSGNASNITDAKTMILVPQTGVTAASAYSAATTGAGMNGSYIAVEMEIKNATDGTVVAGRQWCCWPVAYSWNPGYKYTYIIDLSQGGYKEYNDGLDATETTDLDPVLDNTAIVFTTVTVDDWTDATDTTVGMLP